VLILAAITAIFVYGMIGASLGLSCLTYRSISTSLLVRTERLPPLELDLFSILKEKARTTPRIDLRFDFLFVLPRSSSFRVLLFILFLFGVGGGIIVTGTNALVSDVGKAHRAIALNLVNLFFGLGALATPFILPDLFARKWVRLCYTMVDPATPDTLAQRLDEQLAATEIGSAVNRMPDGSRETFVWNARNTDSDCAEGG
jgi:MFS family permease